MYAYTTASYHGIDNLILSVLGGGGGGDFRHLKLMSVYIKFLRLKSIPTLKV